MEKNIVIIGNSIAGVNVAENIRERDKDCKITIFSQENTLGYHRPRLIDYLAGTAKLEQILIKKEDYYRDNNIDVMKNCRIEKINTEAKEVVDEKGNVYNYDSLVLALGASSFIPPIKNIDKTGVFAIRTVADCDAVLSFLKKQKNKKAVLLGGGLLGLEVANSLIKQGCHVSVVEMAGHLLSRQFNPEASELLQSMLEEKGFEFFLESSAQEVLGEDKVEAVVFASGKRVEADLVIVSAGVRSNLDLARSTGIEVERGIIVDDAMLTSAKDVYAVGDCCQHDGIVYGQVVPAIEQARVAAQNVCGIEAAYTGTKVESRLKILGLPALSLGDVNNDLGEVLEVKDKDRYLKVCIDNNSISSCIALGAKDDIALVSAVVAGRKPIEDVLALFK